MAGPSRRGILALAAAIAAVPAVVLAEENGPLAFLTSIYGQYGPGLGGVPLGDAAALQLWFSPALAGLIQADRDAAAKVDEVPMLDGDPFIDAQDGDITDVQVSVGQVGGGKAVGHVSFRNTGEPRTIELDLIETAAGWRIDDIHWDNEASLRGLYTH